MKCSSFWGHDWVDLPDSQPWYEYTWKRVCRKCGLIQRMKECSGHEAFVYVDVGYAENKEELAFAWGKINAERNRKSSLENQEKERSIRENVISTSELIKQEPKEE